MQTISPRELASLLENTPENISLIDVRNTDEYAEVRLWEAQNIPLHLLPLRMNEVNQEKQIIFICRSGGRSGQACKFIEEDGLTGYNLTGGMIAFEEIFPEKIIRNTSL